VRPRLSNSSRSLLVRLIFGNAPQETLFRQSLVFLVLNELRVKGGMTTRVTYVLASLLVLSAGLAIVYACRRTVSDLKRPEVNEDGT
jgi:hypothetical protein